MTRVTKRANAKRPARTGTVAATADKMTVDGFVNFAARLGMGAQNVNSEATYIVSPLTRNRLKLEAMYRGSWVVGAAVDCVAEDMTRAGIDVRGEDNPERVEKIQSQLTHKGCWTALTDLVRWSRLYGGAIAFIVIDGQDASTPLDLNTVSLNQFKGLRVYDRWQVEPSLELATGGMYDGAPMYYKVTDTDLRIHHSRVIRMIGVALPYWQSIEENYWGESVIERIYDRLVAFDTATTGAMNLLQRAYLRTVQVERLREVLAAGGQPEENLLKMFHVMRQLQTNEGITLLDKEDQFATHSYGFSGISDMLLQFGQQIAGALGIPLVRLFGQSPAGLSSTGESDMRMYYDNIAAQQESRMRDGIERLLRVLYRSLFGEHAPQSFDFDFCPLWQTSNREKADIAALLTDTVIKAHDAGLVDAATAMRELRGAAEQTGVFTSITSEAIADAEITPPPVETVEPDDGEVLTA